MRDLVLYHYPYSALTGIFLATNTRGDLVYRKIDGRMASISSIGCSSWDRKHYIPIHKKKIC